MSSTLEVETSLITFAEQVLGFSLYPWQCRAVEPFDEASQRLVQVSLATPNGSGKSAVVIPTLVLGWLALYPRGRVVLTTADGKQLDGQVMPAIEAHQAKFPHWHFIEREITTPTGGRFVAWTTDQSGRAEGWHKLDDTTGPLLIIADEAKTIPDEIFAALDRCTYNGIMLASSPGRMSGRFYDSQFSTPGFIRIKVGLVDCPHIPEEKIKRIIAQHGEDAPFTRSTLYGEFMQAEGEARFDREGLKRLSEMSAAHDKQWRAEARRDPALSVVGELVEQPHSHGLTWLPDAEAGWLWNLEGQHPIPGCSYIGWCDPMTGEQSQGAKERDTHAAGILRLGYIDESGPHPVEHNDEVVAILHHEGGCRWDNDILAERFAMLLKHWKCPAIVEANNSGTEVIRLLLLAGCQVWRRQKRDHRNPGKLLDVVGFQTNGATKNLWIGALGRGIREQTLDCRYPLATSHFQTFMLNEAGAGEAQSGCHDDFVTGVGLGLYGRQAAARYHAPLMPRVFETSRGMMIVPQGQFEHGALA